MSAASTLLRITHQTVYRYARPVAFQPHRLVMRPREGHDLRVEDLTLTIAPRCELVWTRDVFGNSVAYAWFMEPAQELRIDNHLLVRRFGFDRDPGKMRLASPPEVTHESSPNPPPLSPANAAYPVSYDPLEQALVGAYLAPVYPEDGATLQPWLRAANEMAANISAEDIVLQLTGKIHQSINYRRREEKGVQSPASTLTAGTGSCRDFATLLMESLRHVGLAARFASGYLDCTATRAARGATHAWTEVYFPNLGWRGYDPTTGKRCTDQHIVTGVSNHPRGVMPISGKFLGASADYVGMSVIVTFAEANAGTSASAPPGAPPGAEISTG